MKNFKQHLQEATFNLDNDVNFIYNKYFKKYLDYMHKNKEFLKVNKATINSSMLRSSDSKKAHEVNPVKIYIGGNNGNIYLPFKKEIHLSLNDNAVSAMQHKTFKNSSVRDTGNPMLADEFSAKKVKATIYHELSHWVDDSLHGNHIANTLTKHGGKLGTTNISVGVHPIEINAQIHGVKAYKQQMNPKKYDRLTFDELVSKNVSLNTVVVKLKKTGEYETWRKIFIKRLDRENLLGKSMHIKK